MRPVAILKTDDVAIAFLDVRIALGLDRVVGPEQIDLNPNVLTDFLQRPVEILFVVHLGEGLAVGDETKPDCVLENMQVLIGEPIVLGVDVLGNETEEAFLGGGYTVAAAHGEPEHEGLVLDHHATAKEDVDVVVRFEVGCSMKNIDARQVELGVFDKLDNQWHIVLFEAELVELRIGLL